MKFKVTRTDGKNNSENCYLVVNIDEPYAGIVADLIEIEERRKGTWEHGDKTMREVSGMPSPFLKFNKKEETQCQKSP